MAYPSRTRFTLLVWPLCSHGVVSSLDSHLRGNDEKGAMHRPSVRHPQRTHRAPAPATFLLLRSHKWEEKRTPLPPVGERLSPP